MLVCDIHKLILFEQVSRFRQKTLNDHKNKQHTPKLSSLPSEQRITSNRQRPAKKEVIQGEPNYNTTPTFKEVCERISAKELPEHVLRVSEGEVSEHEAEVLLGEGSGVVVVMPVVVVVV